MSNGSLQSSASGEMRLIRERSPELCGHQSGKSRITGNMQNPKIFQSLSQSELADPLAIQMNCILLDQNTLNILTPPLNIWRGIADRINKLISIMITRTLN